MAVLSLLLRLHLLCLTSSTFASPFRLTPFNSNSASYVQFPLPQKQEINPTSNLSLDQWIEWEEKNALNRLLSNIAPNGQNAQNAAPGTVLASPSTEYPNYYFQWIRDAAITLQTLIPEYEKNSTSPAFSIFENYITLSQKLQHQSNPSGTFSDLSSLGEPKFLASGAPFTGNWGRPQRDGPALRAITLMAYLRAYNESHPDIWASGSVEDRSKVFGDLYSAKLPANSVIKADLEYVARYWYASGFDLWEEVNGLHMFTASVQLRALREGADIARAFGDYGASTWYDEQADSLEILLKSFWDDQRGYLVETLDSHRTGLDCAVLLGAIHGDPLGKVGGWAPFSDEILSTLLEFVKDQRYRFPINMIPSRRLNDDLAGTGVGRYPEDVYDGYGNSPNGGNPWFLCTATVSEVLFRTATNLKIEKKLQINTKGLNFWQTLLPKLELKVGQTFESGSGAFNQAIERLHNLGDEYIEVIRTHSDANGALSEQFDRHTGFERGARDLTWSYGAFLQAITARKNMITVVL